MNLTPDEKFVLNLMVRKVYHRKRWSGSSLSWEAAGSFARSAHFTRVLGMLSEKVWFIAPCGDCPGEYIVDVKGLCKKALIIDQEPINYIDCLKTAKMI